MRTVKQEADRQTRHGIVRRDVAVWPLASASRRNVMKINMYSSFLGFSTSIPELISVTPGLASPVSELLLPLSLSLRVPRGSLFYFGFYLIMKRECNLAMSLVSFDLFGE